MGRLVYARLSLSKSFYRDASHVPFKWLVACKPLGKAISVGKGGGMPFKGKTGWAGGTFGKKTKPQNFVPDFLNIYIYIKRQIGKLHRKNKKGGGRFWLGWTPPVAE